MALALQPTQHGLSREASHGIGLLSEREKPSKLASLSPQICLMILSSPGLNQQDWMAVRLVCKHFDTIGASLVFRRVVLSALRSDRDAFINIVSNPDLARHVKELVWYELPRGTPTQFRPLSKHSSSLVPDLLTVTSDLFWLPASSISAYKNNDPTHEFDVAHTRAIHEFQHIFTEALGNMPKLYSLVSEPMPISRCITNGDYPITLNLLTSHLLEPQADKPHDVTFNDGLIHFLLPELSRAATNIEKFRWVDHHIFETMSRIWIGNQVIAPLPCNLTSIDLGLTWLKSSATAGSHRTTQLFMRFRHWLHSATGLLHLRLCHEHILGLMTKDDADLGVLFDGRWDSKLSWVERQGGERGYSWKNRDHGYVPWPQLQSLALDSFELYGCLDRFLKEHSPTMRHLYFKDCGVTIGMVKRFAAFPGLNLTCIDLQYTNTSHHHVVSEDALLRYLNRETPALPLSPCESSNQQACEIATQQYKASKSMKGGQAMGTDSNNATEDSEDDGQEDVPHWQYGSFVTQDNPAGEKFKWTVPKGTPFSFPTIVWKFTSRHGQVAYGMEPLDWFEEWDESAGDTAEATPRGSKFTSYLKQPVELDHPLPEDELPEEAEPCS